jgi:predicted O-methyltransferase YrrM
LNNLFGIPYRYLKYWLLAIDQHSLHAPFVYELYTNVIKDKNPHPNLKYIDEVRKQILNDSTVLNINDCGAGSKKTSSKRRKVKEIARSGLSSKKFSQLLYNLIAHYKPGEVIELGTSLGLNTLYLASFSPEIKITTFEGCPETASYAQSVFEKTNKKNISLILGNIDEKLPAFLNNMDFLDFVFFDANHSYTPTLNYFQLCLEKTHHKTLFIFDDIHWSSDMEKAWEKIKQHPKVTMTLDIFDAGLVFFDQALTPVHLVVEY